MKNLSIPKGTRDFGPVEMARRNYIFNTIENVFKMHGFIRIETPAMETLETLMGKYGEEGDRLIFRILNSGDFKNGISENDLINNSSLQLSNLICEKALRYDLTVPFARFVVMHANEIAFPFKRYQLQPVWRADRPQKGRYREFYQCDADVVGSNSLLNELELLQLIDEIFARLNLKITIKINNRKILSGIASYAGRSDLLTDITVAIDKLDKTGIEQVKAELTMKGIGNDALEKLEPLFSFSGNNNDKINLLKKLIGTIPEGSKGIEEMEQVLNYALLAGIEVEFDIALARGLNYYTGTIIEVKSAETAIGSICGGGRYDNLTGIFGMPGLSGVGISFGADRIYDVMLQLNRFPLSVLEMSKVLIVNFGDDYIKTTLKIASELRKAGMAVEIYPDNDKLKKQFSYANSKKIKYVVVAGPDEIASGKLALKNMETGEQNLILQTELISYLK